MANVPVSRADLRPTNRNPDFVRAYFASSRLHFIGSFRARYESMLVQISQTLNLPPLNILQSPSPPPHPLIVHIDMDCFFASIAVLTHPHLRLKPLAVAHSAGEVSSASYQARAFGVRAGMFLREAKKLCPQLVVVPYEFEKYERVCVQVYILLYQLKGVTVEAMSVDEAYLEVSGAVKSVRDAETLVKDLRDRIERVTGCTASAGIAMSKLVARVATKLAKPNGQRYIAPEEVATLFEGLDVRDLPGVGWRTGRKLRAMGVEKVGGLRNLGLTRLQQMFGEKQGKKFHELSLGWDDRPVRPMKPRKSIGAEVSWGVRFEKNEGEKVKRFLDDLSDEVVARLQGAGAKGSRVVLKEYKRRRGESMVGYKHLGHGPCTTHTRSRKVGNMLEGESLLRQLRNVVWSLHVEIDIENEDLRGVGLQITELKFAELSLEIGGKGNRKTIDAYFGVRNGQDGEKEIDDEQEILEEAGEDEQPEQIESDFESAEEVEMSDSSPLPQLPSPSQRISPQGGGGAVADEDVDSAAVAESENEVQIADDDISADPVAPVHRELSQVVVSQRDGSQKESAGLPSQWDAGVFRALPSGLQKELLAERSNNGQERGGRRGKKRGRQQMTMTQMGGVEQVDIPSPPSTSESEAEVDEENDSEEDLMEIWEAMTEWMEEEFVERMDEVKNRLVEMIRLGLLEKVRGEMRIMKEVGRRAGAERTAMVETLVTQVQSECRVRFGCALKL